MSENRGLVRHIPNILTLLNLACGFLALYFIGYGAWGVVIPLIVIAGLADVLDGLVARALKVSSPIGAQLDSLADMVSFGIVPGMILFASMTGGRSYDLNRTIDWYSDTWIFSIPLLIFPICAALRLARFNVEDDSAGDFIGLSSPSACAVVIGYLISPELLGHSHSVLYVLGIGLGLLMVSKISMFSLKFKGKALKGNELRYVFIALFFILMIIYPKEAILVTMLLYILTNTILHYYRKLTA